ncbi:Protein of unknown function [Lactobacillus helveticus CIRM-BIA 953]|uniref:Uncharacterized protein n=1 Tax=Lactobacillus helveticus CIRM-BIA 953 TaxID=1226335 RepID=U4QHT7_LACHE|nr:Protein of unknown function [Lactobacillus helveticus CIRM-BIA 953]
MDPASFSAFKFQLLT